MVYGILKLLNFAHGDVYMVGAFIGFGDDAAARVSRRGRPCPVLARLLVLIIGCRA